MSIIFVSGKYTDKKYIEIEENIKLAEYASIELLRRGWVVICPHKNYAHFEIYQSTGIFDYDFWLKCSIEILKKCDAIFLLHNWINSNGSKIEFEYALTNKIKIYYEKDGYPELTYEENK